MNARDVMTDMATDLMTKSEQVLSVCNQKGIVLACAESCTGGMISTALTGIAGSSSVVDRGFVTYTNEAKHEMLGVREELFQRVGAVSEEVARAMAEGAVHRSNAQMSISVTGIAGPGGGSDDKPVGLVHMAVASDGGATLHERHVFAGNRQEVREQTVVAAFNLILCALDD